MFRSANVQSYLSVGNKSLKLKQTPVTSEFALAYDFAFSTTIVPNFYLKDLIAM